MRNIALVAVVALAALPGCSKKSKTTSQKTTASAQKSAAPAPKPAPTPAASASAAKPAASVAAKGPTVELKIASVGNKMKFDKAKLTVKAGSTVHLVFHNNSTLSAMQHNWVLLKPGSNVAKVANGEAANKAQGYAKANPAILAHTPLADKGKTVDVTFKAPAPGTYPYICTFPGHYLTMHGQLVVTK